MQTAPSRRVIVYLLLTRSQSKMALKDRRIQSMIDSPSTVSGEIAADMPRINSILNRLDPMALPSARLLSPFLEATTDVTSSGKEVPTAIIVRPIKL